MLQKLSKILLLIAVLIGCAGCAGEGITEATETAMTFKEEYLPLIVQFATTAAGVVSVLFLVLKPVLAARSGFSSASKQIEAFTADTTSFMQELGTKTADFEQSIQDKVQALDEMYRQREEQSRTEFEQRESEFKTMFALIKADIAANRIALTNDPYLVSNGYAKQIAEVFDEVKTDEEQG